MLGFDLRFHSRFYGIMAVLFGIAMAPAAAAENCAVHQLAELPLLPSDEGSPIVSIMIGDQSRRVLLDTGGFWSMITPQAAAGLRHRASPLNAWVGLDGLPLTTVASAPSAQIDRMHFNTVDFLVAPDGYMQDVDATVGANWLKIFDVEIDPGLKKVSFLSPEHCEGKVVYWPHDDLAELPVRYDAYNHWMSIPVTLDGEEIRALIDTGSSETTLSLQAARLRFGLTADSAGVERAGMTRGRRGRDKQLYQHQFGTLDLDGIAFKNPRITLAPMIGNGPEMIIGMHHLGSLHLYFAYGEKKLYATTLRGDAAARQRLGTQTAMATPAVDPIARANAREKLKKAYGAFKDKDFTAAELAIDEAMAIAPGLAEVYIARASLRTSRNQIADAQADLDEAIRLDPQDPAAFMTRSIFYRKAGKAELAVADASQAVEIQPSSPATLNNRCWLYIGLGQLDAALADCNAALAIAPENASILDSRGLVHLRAGRLDQAIADYDHALSRNARLASSLYGRAQAKRGKGDTAGADADEAAARTIDPKIADGFGK